MGQSYRATAAFRKRGIVSLMSDLIWPPRSLLSEAIVDRPGVIEPERWAELNFLAGPRCFQCGFPLPEEDPAETVCAACAGRKRSYDCARAALHYDDQSQAGLSASERRRNVAGAIKASGRFEGKTMLVVDDVFTTGATLEACARALKKAGAAQVHAVTLARVVRPIDILL